MAGITCKYHPRIPARWECNGCNIAFCPDCVSSNAARDTAICPLCRQPASRVTASNFITPFWRRIPKFFLYPANPGSMIVFILTVFVSIVAQFSLIGLIVQLFLLLVFLRYCMEVLRHTSEGHLDPPVLSLEMMTGGLLLPIKLILFFVAAFFSIYYAYVIFGNPLATIWLIFLLAGIPASIMLLAIDNVLYRAINPVLIFNVMRKVGLPYLVLYLFLIMTSSVGGFIVEKLIVSENLFLLFISAVLELYMIVIMWNMMGYLIYQYQDELGYSTPAHIEYKQERANTHTGGSDNPIMNEVEVLIKEGRLDDAIIVIENNIHQDRSNLQLHARYHELLKHTGKQEKLATHGEEYMNLLLHNNQIGMAANVYQTCQKIQPDIRPVDPEKFYDMACILQELREFKSAAKLLNGFHIKFPRHVDIVRNYFLAAKILCGELQRPEQALKIIRFLQEHYPDDPLHDEINDYHAFICSLAVT